MLEVLQVSMAKRDLWVRRVLMGRPMAAMLVTAVRAPMVLMARMVWQQRFHRLLSVVVMVVQVVQGAKADSEDQAAQEVSVGLMGLEVMRVRVVKAVLVVLVL